MTMAERERPSVVRIAAAQLGPSSSTKQENVKRMVRLMEAAAGQGVTLLSFPELALTPYFPADNTREFEHHFDELPAPLTEPLFEAARTAGIAFVLPYAERSGVCFFNTALVVDGAGVVAGKYRKVHLPANFHPGFSGSSSYEKMYFTPGDLGFPVFRVNGVSVGVQICYDRQFPEGYRCLALDGAQIIFTPTVLASHGNPARVEMWPLTLRARAIENGVFVVGIGKAGSENGIDHVGASLVISPLGGQILARAATDEDELVVSDLDLADVTEARRRLPWGRDRRPAEYRRLTENGRP